MQRLKFLAPWVFVVVTIFNTLPWAQAAEPGKLKFSYREAEFVKVLEDYALATGQKFVVDPSIKAKITLINPEPISEAEAFNQLSSALALNGIGISNQEGVMQVLPARHLQRDYIPVVFKLPPLRPERMCTYIINLKYVSADEVNKNLRILLSKDGELVTNAISNKQLIVSDWVSNLHRVAAIIEAVDQPSAAGALEPTPAPKAFRKAK